MRRGHRGADRLSPLFHALAKLGHLSACTAQAGLSAVLAQAGQLNSERLYVIDRFSLSVCDNLRIRRCRRDPGAAWRGYQPSRRRDFYGLKIHRLVTAQGQPVEFFLTPGAYSDTKALKLYAFDWPDNAIITEDKADHDDGDEDRVQDVGLRLIPLRKQNSKRPLSPAVTYWMSSARKAVETTGSLIGRLLPRHIHSVTAAGFELKVGRFVLACRLNFVF